jgi:putative ATPase
MRDLSYGKDYQYAHDEADAIADMQCLPDSLADRRYYNPTDRGFEKDIRRRLEEWKAKKLKSQTPKPKTQN